MVLDSSTDAAIKRAIIRATARNIQATQLDAVTVGYDRTVYYQVGAFSHTGSHRVALHYTADGVTAVCDCEAGQNERICHHVAAALMAEEMPQVEPDAAPADDLEARIQALAARLQRYWTTEVGTRAEYDRLRAELQVMKAELAERTAPVHIDPNFISDLMTPPAGY